MRISQVKEKDPGPLQYDWFLNTDKTVTAVKQVIPHWIKVAAVHTEKCSVFFVVRATYALRKNPDFDNVAMTSMIESIQNSK